MIKVLLVLHVFVTLALIGVVLIQRSEGGGLGLGAGQGMGSFMSGRGTANLLTRTTAVLGTVFFALSLTLALLYRGGTGENAATILAAPPPANIPGTANPQPLPATPSDARPSNPTIPTGPLPNVPNQGVPNQGVPNLAVPMPAPASPAKSGTP